MAQGFPPLYTDEQMERFQREKTALQKRIASQEPIKVSMTGGTRIARASERKTIAPSNKIAETTATQPKGVSRYAQTRELAGQTFSESPLKRRIKQNMETMRWGPIGVTTDSGGGGGDFGRISGNVRWMDPHAAYARANPFAGLGLSEKRRAELRREAKFDEIMGRYGNKFGGQIASAYFGTPGMAGKELDKTVSALQARAQQNIARTRAESDKAVAEIGAEAMASRPGTPIMRYQAVSNEEGVPQVLDKVTGEFKGQEMTKEPEYITRFREGKFRNIDDMLYQSKDLPRSERLSIFKHLSGSQQKLAKEIWGIGK